jgi:UDP-glucose 4-epimerase
VGSRLAAECLAAGWEVLALDDLSAGWRERLPSHPRLEWIEADAAEPGRLAALVAQHRPAHLVHLAARVGVRSVLADPEGCRRANLRLVEAVAEAVAAAPPGGAPRVWAASSSEVYADALGPLAEDAPLRPLEGAGRWAYAASKREGEERLDAALAGRGAAGPVHLRFFNVVGPGQDATSGMVLPTFVESALEGRPLPVHGDGSQLRTYAHVDEVARTLRELLEHDAVPPGPLNLGGRARCTVLELAGCVLRHAGGGRIERVDPRRRLGEGFEEVPAREPDLTRLAALGVALPAAGLDELVADTLARHADLARPAAHADRSPRPDGVPCASPASSPA